eukprot:CAMPEP_0170603540 /NCGR_PEP_ID=MMETSP0224-20130122/18966_1 /TAXON_ID=285029 /ORGANISM="Togula jolla, Strain CCCM 725" /LENGTH=762 /DNA_ID=CAMNT_0010928427 /DNA_START=187 /DNA_END=2475 /DNA_ORIENTATION=+
MLALKHQRGKLASVTSGDNTMEDSTEDPMERSLKASTEDMMDGDSIDDSMDSMGPGINDDVEEDSESEDLMEDEEHHDEDQEEDRDEHDQEDQEEQDEGELDSKSPHQPDGHQRSLLSKRDHAASSGGCKFCACLITDAAKCGTDVVENGAICGYKAVTSGAECGYKTVKSAAECGESVTKMCDARRRRRGSRRRGWYVPKVKCSFSKVAKSCNVPRKCDIAAKCNVPKSCNMASSFNDCLSEITKSLPSDIKPMMKLVENTGCGSVSKCKNRIKSGLDEVTDVFDGLIQSGMKTAVKAVENQIGKNVMGWTQAAAAFGKDGYSTIKDAVMEVEESVTDFVGGALPAYQKFDLGGKLCLPKNFGFWYMKPTDCGSFGKVEDIFENIQNPEPHFNAAKSSFLECLKKTGLMKFPTPFFDLEWEEVCMPDFLQVSMEYIVGAGVFGAQTGASLYSSLSKVIDQLKKVADSQLSLLELGRSISDSQAEDPQSLFQITQNSSSEGSQECGSVNNWAVDIAISLGLSAQDPAGGMVGFEFGTGISIGCKNGVLQKPNWIFMISFGAGQTLPSGKPEASAAPEISLAWGAGFPEFNNRVATQCVLDITPEVGLELGVELAIGSPVSFVICPNVEVPSGFSLGVSPTIGNSLSSLGVAARSAADEAQGGVLGAITAATGHLARADLAENFQLDKAELAAKGADMSMYGDSLIKAQRRSLEKAAASDGPSDADVGKSSEAEEAVPVTASIAIRAGAAFAFCITPGECFGQ